MPKRGTSGQEQLGVALVSAVVHREPSDGGLGFIYRPLHDADKGVDGIIETVDHTSKDRDVTGKLVAVQVKSGSSFFRRATTDGWLVYIDKPTVHYWRHYSLPVILTVVDTADNVVYWTLASEGEFAATKTKYKIPVSKTQRLDATAADAIAALATQPPPAFREQLSVLVTELSNATATQLDQHRQEWRRGRRSDARKWVDAMVREPTRLAALAPAVAARVLRWAAAVALDDQGDLDKARALATEAHRKDPEADDTRIQAGIAIQAGNVNSALALLASSAELSARLMHAFIMCRVGDYDAAAALLPETTPSAAIDAADMWRLHALLRYTERDLAGAVDALQHADQYVPDMADVRLMRAILMYLGAIVPGAWPVSFPIWPQPIPEFFIRGGDDATRQLASAAAAFDELLHLDWSAPQRRCIEAWHIAALCGIAGDREPAIGAAKKVLAGDPSQPYVLVWAAREGFPIDFERHLDALEIELERTHDVGVALAYVAARLWSGHAGAVDDWLDRWRLRFEEAGAGPEWVFWRARASLTAGDVARARSLLPDVSDERATALEAEILHAEARISGDRSALSSFLESAAKRTGNVQYTVEACDAYASAGDWDAVIPYIDSLLRQLPTPYVWHLALSARFHTGDFAGCLALLDEVLPLAASLGNQRDLRRMRAEARFRTGDVPGAISDIQSVIAESGARPRTTDLLILARAQFLAGHTHELAACARRLRGHDDLTARDALQLSEVLAHDDSSLARELWHYATARGVADSDVPTAVWLGFQLGLDADTGPLLARMNVLAAAGNPAVQQFTIDELITKNQEWLAERARIWDLYRNAEIPSHAVAEFLKIPLVQLYRFEVGGTEARQRVSDKFPLQLRDGSRPIPTSGSVVAPGRLAMDLSALILAANLGILGEVERHFAPIRLPQLTLVALREQRDKFKPHQPSRVDITYQLVAAYNRGWISAWDGPLPALDPQDAAVAGNWPEWVALLTRARDEGAFVLDLPLDATPAGQSPYDRPASLVGQTRLARLITIQDIRRVLHSLGLVAPPSGPSSGTAVTISGRMGGRTAADVLEGDGAEQEPVDAAAVSAGDSIYLTTAGAEALAADGLLEAAGEVFTLLVDPTDQQTQRDQLDALRRMEKDADWVDGLIRHISDGLGDGRYILLPESGAVATRADHRGDSPVLAAGAPDVEHEHIEACSPADDSVATVASGDTHDTSGRRLPLVLQCLANLMSVAPDTVDCVWVDDRWSSKFRFAGTARMTELLEVLAGLESAQHIDVARRWQIYFQLRAANTRILPLSADEILHHLRSAPIRDGAVAETAPLRVLRQYAAALLEDATRLRVPSAAQLAAGDTGELEVMRSYASAVRGALVGLWQVAKNEPELASRSEVVAQSTWLINNLYIDLAVLRSLTFGAAAAADVSVSAFDAAILLTSAFQLLSTHDAHDGKASDDSLAAEYADWTYRTLALSRARRDRDFRTALVAHLGAQFSDWVGLDADDPVVRLIARMLANRTFVALPTELQEALSADTDLMKRLGRTVTRTVTVGPWRVAVNDFADAVAKLLRDRLTGRLEP